MEKALLKLLQKSYDEELSAAEDKLLQKALTNDVALQAEKKKLDAMRRVLGEVDYSFDSVFSENVMARIEMEESIDQGNSFLYAFNRIALPGLAAAIILLLFTVFSSGTLSLESIMGIESIQTEYLSEFLLFNY
jgi:hypothetical protein